MSKPRIVQRSNTTHCPACGNRCRTIKSVQLTPTYREVTYLCLNDECGHIFIASIEATRSLQPSAIPDPEVRLPGPAANR
ncbi:MAG TPA: ogr/Delta-like zinc finger family protein [Candidatus Sulfotelmatobacter sp.]|jgi:hypothetical protein|nr:ogr/Delta-like zinc finger family protein [Candidatus Sulfotelmatobacter sp.]